MDTKRWLRNQRDRATSLLLGLGGLLSLLLGWLGVSDQVHPASQIPYLASGGLLGLFLLGIAATVWLSADLRDEWRKLDDVAAELRHVSAALHRAADGSLDAGQDDDLDPGRNGRSAPRPRRRTPLQSNR